MPEVTIDQWKTMRQKSRTNLPWFCNHVLEYKDVRKSVHLGVEGFVNSLQQFKGGIDCRDVKNKRPDSPGSFKELIYGYEPVIPSFWDLEGPRKVLSLMARGHIKSTMMMGHLIQWIVNYPNVRILLSSGTGDQVSGFLREIKGHFQFNDTFRFLFPEFCPQKRVEDFGNQEHFNVPACTRRSLKEFTMATTSVGSVVASTHYDVIDNDDVVDKENVRTPDQILNVKSHLGYLWPLLETAPDSDKRADGYRRGWWYMIGTIYDFSDPYSTVLDDEEKRPKGKKSYFIYKRSAILEGELSEESCTKQDCGIDGKHEIIDHCKTIWPSRMPARSLLEIAQDPLQGWEILSSQYLMNPIPAKSGLIEDQSQIVWVPPDAIRKLYAYLSLHVTVDLAGMEPSTNKLADNDYTVINLHGFGHDGTLYILSVLRGRYTPFEVIDLLFNLAKIHPRLLDIKVEKEAHARVLLPFLKREMAKRQRFLPVVEIHRDNRTSKQQRIKGLQPWFRNGSIKFADSQPHKLAIINEIMRFPKFAHDDILDTIADAMQNRDGGVISDVLPQEKTMPDLSGAKYLGDDQWQIPNMSTTSMTWDKIAPQNSEDVILTVDSLTGW